MPTEKITIDINTQRFGRLFARGVIHELLMWFGIILVVGMLIGFISHDDTDPPGFWRHSGLRVYRDARTGVEYLSTPNGMTPRLPSPPPQPER